MIISIEKGRELVKERDRLYKRAIREREQSKQFFELGYVDFADYLQESNKHFGMAEQINKTLKRMGYDEKKYSAHDRQMIRLGIQQKLMGLLFIAISVFMMAFDGDGTVGLLFIPMGIYLIFTKKCLIYHKRIKENKEDKKDRAKVYDYYEQQAKRKYK